MPPFSKGKRAGIFLALIILLFLGMTYLAWSTRRVEPVSLPDGTHLVLTRFTVGKLNKFKHGTELEKLAGRFIPPKGLSVLFLKWKFSPPTIVTNGWGDVPELGMEFRLDGKGVAASTLANPPFYRNVRVLHWGDDGFPYVEELFPAFKKYSDGVFAYVSSSAFSRRSRLIHLQFQQRDTQEGPWRVIADFSLRNPLQTKDEKWLVGPTIQSNKSLAVSLGQIQVKTNKNPYNDIWLHTVEVPFQFFERGRPATNWAAHQIYVTDSTGNKLFLGASKTISNNIVTYPGSHSPDPFATWRLRAHFTRDSGFDPTNLLTVQVPIPLTIPISTNLGGLPLTIDFVNGSMLAMSMPTNFTNLRLLFLDAQNQSGHSVQEFTGSWGQHLFWRSIDLEKARPSMSVSVAVVDDFEFEFTAKPQLLEEIEPPQKTTRYSK